jgi:hypothetical protein
VRRWKEFFRFEPAAVAGVDWEAAGQGVVGYIEGKRVAARPCARQMDRI